MESGQSWTKAPVVTVLTGALASEGLKAFAPYLSEIGVRTVELAVGPGAFLERADPGALSELQHFGLEVCGVAAPSIWWLGSRDLLAAVDIADVVGARFVRVFAPPYDRSRPAIDQLEEVMSALDAVRAKAAPRSVELLVETAQETVIPSPELARRVIEGVGSDYVGVVYDPANMAVEGSLQAPYAVSYLGKLLRHVHAKNLAFVRRDGAWSHERAELDRGYLDWVDIGAALAANGYLGLVSIDHLSGPATAERLLTDVSVLRRLLNEGATQAAQSG